uniref:Dynein axonemal intermediate chain 4 n=2 Tax=Nemorhina TaxID=44051 RepID=A0A1B0C1C2_9MUSC
MNKDGQISVLELLELQARARAIRSQLALEPVTKIEVDSDEDISKSGKNNKSVQESLISCNELKRISSGQESQKPLKQIKSNASAVETYKTNIQLMNQTERRKKIKLKRNYRCTSAQELNAEKGETTEKIHDEEKEDKENEKRKDHNQENTTIFIKQEKNVRRSLSPDVIPIILEAETLLISDSSDADDEYTKNKNAENSFKSKEEEVHKEIPKECDDTLSTPTKENVEADKNFIENTNKDEDEAKISLEGLQETVKNEGDHSTATISDRTNRENVKVKDHKQNGDAPMVAASRDIEKSQPTTTSPIVKTTPLSISDDEDDDERNDDVISLEGGDLENEMIEHLQNDASNTNSSFTEIKTNTYDEEQKSQDESQPDDVISLDSSDDEHRKNTESWHSRYIKSSKVSKVLAASRLSKRVRDKIKKSKRSKKNASREDLNLENRESTPDFKSRHEDGSVEQYKELLELRQQKVLEMSFDPEKYLREKLDKLIMKINDHELIESSKSSMFEENMASTDEQQTKCLGSINLTLDDIVNGIKLSKISLDVESGASKKMQTSKYSPIDPANPFIKIILRKTSQILLYEQRSVTVLRDTEEGRKAEEENACYMNLNNRRNRFDKETQANVAFCKTRSINTDFIFKSHVASYVSNFEMFDTYKDLERTTLSVDVNGNKKIQVITYKVKGVDKFLEINRLPNFKLALMLTLRILASNTYEKQQRRFRNMIMPDSLALDIYNRYRIDHLWTFTLPLINTIRKFVTDICWCPSNGDFLAASYAFSTSGEDVSASSNGCVCIWNIKNPVNPERYYNFKVSVVTLEFSPFATKLLSIGLYDGSVYVYDISNIENPQVAVSERKNSTNFEPITSIKWVRNDNSYTRLARIEPFLALCRNGSITRYSIIDGPYLLGFPLMELSCVENNPRDLNIERTSNELLINCNAQGSYICLDAWEKDIYYVLTNEGCQHKCSINCVQQELEVSRLHEAGINAMDFSPWSPKLYLTCGNDWCIHIWMSGICRPLITLKYYMSPVLMAAWSKTHSSIIISLNRTSIDVWDLKRSVLKPYSSTRIDPKAEYTTFRLSNCGRSVAVGNSNGQVEILAFEDMPFPPHFQYEHLEKTLLEIICNDKHLLEGVKSLGYFGYPENDACMK